MGVLATAALVAATYCNPLTLPDYPRGAFAQADEFQAQLGAPELVSRNGSFREAGDPAVIVENGVWYMYVSGVMSGCWKSVDHGATWQRVDNGLPPFALGYAPTIVKFRGKFLACGGWGAKKGSGALYRADSPEGPFAFVGRLKPPRNDGAPNCADPMLFADGDRLYFYWGCTPDKGIWGCELDPDDPLKALTPAKRLVAYDPEHQPWEKFPNRPFGFVEGGWMFKRNGGYYLMFAAGGTEFPTYATGVARGTSPLGEFVLQRNNPVFFSPSGVVTGTAHGSVIRDDRDEWWYFYTVHASIRHRFERRIGMDRLTFDANGDVVARSASSEPQPLSGAFPEGRPWRAIEGVSYSAGAAFDRSLRTEFAPVKLPYEVEFEFLKAEDVRANRVIWSADGPVGYRIDLKGTDGKWTTAIDATGNAVDLIVDYRELAKTRAKSARLTVVSAPDGVPPRLVEWTLFADTPRPERMSVPAVRPVSSDYTVACHHCPLWNVRTNGYSMFKDILGYPDRKPLLGYYDEANAETTDWQVKWALEHGVNCFIFCWYRAKENVGKPVTRDALHQGHALDAFVVSPQARQMKFAVMWECDNAGGAADERDLVENLVPFWAREYFARPNYLTWKGKPVVFVYEYFTRTLLKRFGAEGLRKAFAAADAKARQLGCGGIDFMNEDRVCDPGRLAEAKSAGYSHSFDYCVMTPRGRVSDETAVARQLAVAKRRIAFDPNAAVLTVSKGWDPEPWYRKDPTSSAYKKMSQWNLSPESWKRALEETKKLMETLPEGAFGRRFVMLDNWNEWCEGHYICPHAAGGFRYLDAVRDVFTNRDNAPDHRRPEELGFGPYEGRFDPKAAEVKWNEK